jgi:hypothetical protein
VIGKWGGLPAIRLYRAGPALVGAHIFTTAQISRFTTLVLKPHGEHENMTIGSSYNHPANLAIEPPSTSQPWAALPETTRPFVWIIDFTFDHYPHYQVL